MAQAEEQGEELLGGQGCLRDAQAACAVAQLKICSLYTLDGSRDKKGVLGGVWGEGG